MLSCMTKLATGSFSRLWMPGRDATALVMTALKFDASFSLP
jgi:hypothetical protein